MADSKTVKSKLYSIWLFLLLILFINCVYCVPLTPSTTQTSSTLNDDKGETATEETIFKIVNPKKVEEGGTQALTKGTTSTLSPTTPTLPVENKVKLTPTLSQESAIVQEESDSVDDKLPPSEETLTTSVPTANKGLGENTLSEKPLTTPPNDPSKDGEKLTSTKKSEKLLTTPPNDQSIDDEKLTSTKQNVVGGESILSTEDEHITIAPSKASAPPTLSSDKEEAHVTTTPISTTAKDDSEINEIDDVTATEPTHETNKPTQSSNIPPANKTAISDLESKLNLKPAPTELSKASTTNSDLKNQTSSIASSKPGKKNPISTKIEVHPTNKTVAVTNKTIVITTQTESSTTTNIPTTQPNTTIVITTTPAATTSTEPQTTTAIFPTTTTAMEDTTVPSTTARPTTTVVPIETTQATEMEETTTMKPLHKKTKKTKQTTSTTTTQSTTAAIIKSTSTKSTKASPETSPIEDTVVTEKSNTTDNSNTGYGGKIKTWGHGVVKKYGALRVLLIILSVLVSVFLGCILCRRVCCRRRWHKIRQRKLREIGQEKEFLLSDRKFGSENKYSNDRVTLLDDDSEDEF